MCADVVVFVYVCACGCRSVCACVLACRCCGVSDVRADVVVFVCRIEAIGGTGICIHVCSSICLLFEGSIGT